MKFISFTFVAPSSKIKYIVILYMGLIKRKSSKKQTLSHVVRSIASKVSRLKSQQESKYVETGNTIDVNSTGIVVALSLVAGGTSFETRTGEKITTRRMMLRGYFHNDNGTPEDCIIRLVVFRRKDVSGTLPTANTLLSLAGPTGFMNKDHMHDYKIYYDTTFVMDTTQHSLIPWKWMKRFNLNVRYNATGGAITELESNGLFVYIYSNVAGTTNCPQFTYRYRHDFLDN